MKSRPDPAGSASARANSFQKIFRFLMPSVADVLFVVLLFGLSAGALGRLLLRDAGTGWHIRNGQQILLTHAIPRVDSFSATMSGQPWYAWEWFYDLLMAVIHQALGLNGVVYYSAAIIAATFAIALYFASMRGANLLIALFLLILSLGASAVHFLARPHIVSWLLTVIWFELVDTAVTKPSRETFRGLFWLPAMMLLWVNVHGGFLVGLILLGAYLAGAGIQYFSEPEARAASAHILRRLATITLLCGLASLINPYGYKLHVHVGRYLADRFLMNAISEFRSPNFHGAAQQCFALLMLITIVALASARRRPHPGQLLVMLFAVYGGLFATRNLPVASLLLTLLGAPLLSESLAAAGSTAAAGWVRGACASIERFGSRMRNTELRLSGHVWLVAGFVVGLWACANGGRLGSAQLINANFDPKRFPVEAVDAIAQHQIAEPVFSLDYWGGYLIYRRYPREKVFIDDRHDFYGDAYIKDYMKVSLAQPGWDEVLDAEHVDWVLMPTESSLASLLRLSPAWKTVHEDSRAVLFERGEKP
jgi:hypothetical protein